MNEEQKKQVAIFRSGVISDFISPTQGQEEPPRMSWARLLKRVFDIDIEHCPNCDGSLKSIACPETCMMDVDS